MIIDNETNKLFLADCLPEKQPEFFPRFQNVLKDCNISVHLLPDTKDIWAVDYMPVQISKDKFVQFAYNPDYLQLKKYQKTISDVDSICTAINLKPVKSTILVDGGNVSKTTDKVIMCDKVFRENKHISERKLISQLEEFFQVDKLYFVPWETNDFIGHADGMVRFIDNDTVLVNDYPEDRRFQTSFRMSLHNAGLNWIELPYNPPNDPTRVSAEGLYLNYLQINRTIIMPTFQCKYDEKALKILEQVFKGQTIMTVDSNELAEEGGILNCITWNIIA